MPYMNYVDLRQKLDLLGYKQKLLPECIPLVQKLFLDLNTTTENLQKYMQIAQQALEDLDVLELGAEPYKCDNSKLIKECNDLHIAFIHFKEQHEKIQRDLRNQIATLNLQLENCTSDKSKLMSQIQKLERDRYKRGSKGQKDKQNEKGFSIDSSLVDADEKIAKLTRELRELENEHLKVVQDNAAVKSQLKSRDDEIYRLQSLLEGGRSYSSANKDCCYKNIDSQLIILQDEITKHKKDKQDLQNQIKEALAKQHEAMRRALHLAERNKQLEKELKEVDEIALKVEQDCNSVVKDNKEKVGRLQDRINESLTLIQTLEQDNAKLKQELEGVQLEKSRLQKQLERDGDERRSLNDKINRFTIIEHDLNLEIDRLNRVNSELKRTSQLDIPVHKKSCKRTKDSTKCCCEDGKCIKNLKDLLDKEVEYRHVYAKQSMEELKNEKDYYMKEYHKVLEQMRNVPSYEISDTGLSRLKQQLEDKEAEIRRLEGELRRVLQAKTDEPGYDRPCSNPSCKNKVRELQIKSSELSHLDMENGTLKAKLQSINETSVFNEDRMKKAFKDMEEHIRKLEQEKTELIKVETTHRSNVSQLEEDYYNVKEQLKKTHAELNNIKANYNQLKLLHEQTDRLLSETQAQKIRAETELATFRNQIQSSNREKDKESMEIARLQSDIQIMKNQLTKLDRDKDDLMNKLDEKTEKVAALEEELSEKKRQLGRCEGEVKELNRKLSKWSNESSSRDHELRDKNQQILLLEKELDKERRHKEAAVAENKRLQNDLTSATYDCRETRNELEITQRQVEDLKRQLQHYVAEIKRTEDLISHKELERNELLDQFRSLSQEANILESNNHTLESEAHQSKIQLTVALDHTSELERKIETQETVIRSYEKQIAGLTGQVAKLEMQLKQREMDGAQTQGEMRQMRELCAKLDNDKDNLRRELVDKEEVHKLTQDKELLQQKLEREKGTLDTVEKLLNEARQELSEHRMLNEDLQREVQRLKDKISQLERDSAATAEQLDLYQGKALEYSQQTKQLRREIANERFSRAKGDGRGYYPSL